MQKQFTSASGTTVYRQLDGNAKASVFYLTGHRSTLDSPKGILIESICEKNSIGMTRFSFFGWGGSVSQDVPENGQGYTTEWLTQALELFDAVTTGPQILIGSSMGGYLQLALAAARPERIHGMIGLAAGFGTNLCNQIQTHYGKHSIYSNAQQDGFDFILEGDGSVAILKDLDISCPIRLYHASDDDRVSPHNMKHISNRVVSKDVVMHLAEQGGHRLNDVESQAWLTKAIKELAL